MKIETTCGFCENQNSNECDTCTTTPDRSVKPSNFVHILERKIKPTFEQLGHDIGKLVQEKQEAYGDSFGKSGQVMKILYPNGISLEQMDDALATIRIIDKLFRIANKKEAFGESPYSDIVGYGLLGLNRDEV